MVRTVIDAADGPARQALLNGQLNSAACPACGQPAAVRVPLLVVDTAAEAALVFVPDALRLPQADQERAIGRLTNRVLASLPAEQRRMYLLQPQTFLSEASFLEAVAALSPPPAGAPAVTVDELVEWLQQARAAGTLETVVAAYLPLLDYAFFLALTERIEQATDPAVAAGLAALRADLVAAIDAADMAARAEIEAAAALLQELVLAPDPAAATRERGAELSPTFLVMLDASLLSVQSEGRSDLAYLLVMIRRVAVEVIEAAMPPDVRLVSRLARTTEPAARRRLLDESPELIDEGLYLAVLESAEAARQGGAPEVAEALAAAAEDIAALRARTVAPA
jgi:hypothetical protein